MKRIGSFRRRDRFSDGCWPCGGDKLAERIRPFANLVRTDAWDEPIVYHKGALHGYPGCRIGARRAHTTPRNRSPRAGRQDVTLVLGRLHRSSRGKAREAWMLKTPAELLDSQDMRSRHGVRSVPRAGVPMARRALGRGLGDLEGKGGFVTAEGEVKPSAGRADPSRRYGRTAIDRKTFDRRTVSLRRGRQSPRCRTGQASSQSGLSLWRKGVPSDSTTT